MNFGRALLALILFAVFEAGMPASAQIFRARGSGGEKEGEVENVFVPPQRSTIQNLNQAKQLIAEEQYAEAVRLLDAVLEQEEDAFFQVDRKEAVHRSVKNEAQRLIGSMPARGLELYRLSYGAKARRALDEAIASADADGLAYVARRFFHTDAGYEAAFLLGLDHLNHGRPLAAALVLQRLSDTCPNTARFEPMLSLACAVGWVQSGAHEKAQDVLIRLKDSRPQRTLIIAGREVAFFDEKSKAVDWLLGISGQLGLAEEQQTDRWLMRRGNPARTAAVSGGAPLMNMLWRVALADDPALEETIRQVRQVFTEQDQSLLPGFHPLVVNDIVLMRTARNLLAVDFESGKRLWEAPVDDVWENLLGRNSPESLLKQPQMLIGLGQRVGDDATFGSLSSDGQLVFSVEDLGFGAVVPNNRMVVVGGRVVQNNTPVACNRLAAHDLRTGKLKWHVGGPSDQFALRLADTFFLGPPLPLMGQLYVLAETKSEGTVSLIVLDAQTGNLLWQQPLANSETSLIEDPSRRIAGITPSYADGVLVCPTAVGAVVAVDLASRSLLWGYRYRRDYDFNQHMMLRMQGVIQPGQSVPVRWAESIPIIVEGRVLITPAESNRIHCLSLGDGKLLWSEKQQDDIFVAHVTSELVVLAGRRGMRGLRLSDGKPGWNGQTTLYPDEACLSGQGFASDGKYYVPLSNATIAAVDLGTGQVVETVRSRNGQVPGNLVCYRGRVLSQGFDGVETFYLRQSAENEVQKRFARDKNDPAALALQGEILLDRGKIAEAVDSLRRAFQADPDPRTKGLLRDAYLDGLRRQFAEYRPLVPQIAELCDSPAEQSALQRVLAEGLHAAGDHAAAVEAYLRLLDSIGGDRQLDAVATGHFVRRDRWALARLSSVMRHVGPEVQEQVRLAVNRRVEAALKSNDPLELRKAFDLLTFDTHGQSYRFALAERLAAADRLLEAESLLWPDVASNDKALAGPALARIARLMEKAGKHTEAAACYRMIAEQFADVVCLDGKTGAALIASLPSDGPISALLRSEPQWPQGKVVVSTEKGKSARQPTYGRLGVRFQGSSKPFMEDRSVMFDQNQRAFAARDAAGNELWRCSIGQSDNVFFNRPAVDGAAHGHLLLMSLGFRIIAIDALGTGGNKPGTVLWDHDMSIGLNLAAARGMPVQLWNVMPWMLQQFHSNRMNNRMNGVGPATSRTLCFQRFRTLCAIDSLTGAPLWTNSNLPANCELFGDDEFVFALPSDQTEATVLRAVDGTVVGKRPIPRSTPGPNEYYHDSRGARKYVPISVSCLAAFGRNIVLWRRHDSQRTLECLDPWEQKTIWGPLKFGDRAQADVVSDELAVICEEVDKKARIVMVSLSDGKVLGDHTIEVTGGFGNLWNVSCQRYADRLVVVTSNQPRITPRNRNLQPLPGVMVQFQPWGYAFGFDLDGKPAWPNPVAIEGLYQAPLQPQSCPIMFLAAQEYIQSGASFVKQQVIINGIDKRTGRLVCDEKIEGASATFEIAMDRSKNAIELRLQQQTVTLKLTDDPWPAEPEKPAQPATPKKKLSPSQAMLKALGRALPEAIPGADGEDSVPEAIMVPADGPG